MIFNIKIIGTGAYLPQNKILSEDLDIRLGKSIGTIERLTNIRQRYYVNSSNSTSQMAAEAAKQALKRAGLNSLEIDCIIATNSVPEQPIPSTASLLQKKLGLEDSGIPSFDINSTCLSHVTALDLMSSQVYLGKYKNVLIASSETASRGLNNTQLESCGLMGDGAAATIISSDLEQKSIFIKSLMKTYSSGAHFAEIRGGGSRIHPKFMKGADDPNFAFDMDGRKIFKLSSQKIEGFLSELFLGTGDTIKDVDLIIPHQASYQSLELMRRRLNISEEQILNIVRDYGNQVSASIPFTLNYAIENKRIKRGDKVLLLGTAAGLSIGALYFKY